METSLKQINQFLDAKEIAVVGVSRNAKKFGNQVFKQLTKGGYTVLPVNPNAKEIEGVLCFTEIEQIPASVDSVLLLTPKSETDNCLQKAIDKNFKNIWIQLDCMGPNSKTIAEKSPLNIVYNKCIFMFANPVNGIHKFHRFCSKVFGKFPN